MLNRAAGALFGSRGNDSVLHLPELTLLPALGADLRRVWSTLGLTTAAKLTYASDPFSGCP